MSQPEFETGELQLPQVFKDEGIAGDPYQPPRHVYDTGYKEQQKRDEQASKVEQKIGEIITKKGTQD